MITIQAVRLNDMLQALDKMADVNITPGGGFALARLRRAIGEVVEDLQPQATKIIEQYRGNEILLQRHLSELNRMEVALVAAMPVSIAVFRHSGEIEPVLVFSLSPALLDDTDVPGAGRTVQMTLVQIRALRDAVLALGKLPFAYDSVVELRRVWDAIVAALLSFNTEHAEAVAECAVVANGEIVVDQNTGETLVDPEKWETAWRVLQSYTWPIPVLSEKFVLDLPDALPFSALDGLEWIIDSMDDDDENLGIDSGVDVC